MPGETASVLDVAGDVVSFYRRSEDLQAASTGLSAYVARERVGVQRRSRPSTGDRRELLSTWLPRRLCR